MGDQWFAERKANVSKKNRQPKLISHLQVFLFHFLFRCLYNLSRMHDGQLQTFQVSRFQDLFHSLTSWQLISHAFSKIQTPKYSGAVGFVSKLDIYRWRAQPQPFPHPPPKKNAKRSRLITFFQPTASYSCHQMCGLPVSLVSRRRQQNIEITKRKSQN